MNIYAVVLARAGSKRFPSKNVHLFGGYPLVSWSIAAGQSSSRITDVIVSSDSVEVQRITETMGASFVERPAVLAGDEASTNSALIHVVERLGLNDEDVLVLLQPTCPLREYNLLNKAIDSFIEFNRKTLIEVASLRLHLGQVGENGEWIPSYRYGARKQDLEPSYIPTGRIYIYKVEHLIQKNPEYSSVHCLIAEKPSEENVNIDYHIDLITGEYILARDASEYDYLRKKLRHSFSNETNSD